MFAKRLSAVREYDSTGGYATRAVRIALVDGTKALEKHLRESDGSTGYGNRRCEYLQHQTATPVGLRRCEEKIA